jgi:chromosome segregation ATPase
MARTNLHELANRLLDQLQDSARDGLFEGKLRAVSAEAGLNSVRSAEAIKLLEEVGRIEVRQRGRRGRDTIVAIRSTEPITLEDAESMLPSRGTRRTSRLTYDEVGQAVVERLLTLARDDGLRAAQVEAFATEMEQARQRVTELEDSLEQAKARETELRIRLKGAEEALQRAEENLQKAFGPQQRTPDEPARPVEDEDARAVLDILRSGRV